MKTILFFLFFISGIWGPLWGQAQPWWQSTVIYQIYPRSFQDSDGDGIGDIQGIISRLDYLQELGVETVWISPFVSGPQADFGYDISDFRSISPEYGTMKDCKALIQALHDRGMRMVFDLVMNHTSDQHEWFRQSRRSDDNPYSDWYIWKEGRGRNGQKPPNNWKAMIGGSGWHHDSLRKQWYWASFLPFQPDLNYRNPEVKAAMLEVVRFWLEEGVDGFRLDIFNALYEDAQLRNNPRGFRAVASDENPNGFFLKSKYTLNQPESIEFAKELRAVLEEYGSGEKMTVGEVFGPPEVLRAYCGENADGLHTVFTFKTLSGKFKAATYRELIEDFESYFGLPLTPVWVFSNHDRVRSFSRFGEDLRKAKLLAALQLTARGVPFIYNGEELGMRQAKIPLKSGLDPLAQMYRGIPQWMADLATEDINRDNCRTPMQWDRTKNAGFTTGASAWLPVNPDFQEVNVESQNGNQNSLLETYRRLLKLRGETRSLQSGSIQLLNRHKKSKVLVYERSKGRERVLVVLNFSKKISHIKLDQQQNYEVLGSSGLDAGMKLTGNLVLEAFGWVILR